MKEEGVRPPMNCKPWFYIEAIMTAVHQVAPSRNQIKIIDEKRAAQPPRMPFNPHTQPMAMGMMPQGSMPMPMGASGVHLGVPTIPGQPQVPLVGNAAAGQVPPGQAVQQKPRLVSLEQLAGSTEDQNPLQLIVTKDSKASAAAEQAKQLALKQQQQLSMQVKTQVVQQPGMGMPGQAHMKVAPGAVAAHGAVMPQGTPQQVHTAAQAQAAARAVAPGFPQAGQALPHTALPQGAAPRRTPQ